VTPKVTPKVMQKMETFIYIYLSVNLELVQNGHFCKNRRSDIVCEALGQYEVSDIFLMLSYVNLTVFKRF
jgi:hypothetical protein